jgi:hypothetical protein
MEAEPQTQPSDGVISETSALNMARNLPEFPRFCCTDRQVALAVNSEAAITSAAA